MIIALYRTDRYLLRPPLTDPIVQWVQWGYRPLGRSVLDTPIGRRKVRLESVPFDVSVPDGSRLVSYDSKYGRCEGLVVPQSETRVVRRVTTVVTGDSHPVDAQTVYYWCSTRREGFDLVRRTAADAARDPIASRALAGVLCGSVRPEVNLGRGFEIGG